MGSMRRALTWVAAAAACLAACEATRAVAATGGSGGAGGERLVLSGSSTMAPLMAAIGARFQALNPGTLVTVRGGGSARGIEDVRDGKADIGMYSRALTDSHEGLYGLPIARDGVCIIVHGGNPVRELSRRRIVQIFTGAVENWTAAGGHGAPVVVINPGLSYSSTELFTTFYKFRHSDIRSRASGGDNAARIAAVAADPNAITYVSVGEAERKAKAGVRIKLLPVDGVAATSANIRTGNYPISRPLTLVTKGLPAGLSKQFIEFSLSSQVSDLVEANDFVPYLD